MAKHKHVVHLSDVPAEAINAPAGSPFGGARQRVGSIIGAQKLGYSFFSVPSGKAAFPYHTHSGNEEVVYILEGGAVLRFGQEEITVSSGTVRELRREGIPLTNLKLTLEYLHHD